MGYKLDDKDIKLSGKQLQKIGTGVKGDVYKYREDALKIFRQGTEPPIDLETAEYLASISTSQILLPKRLLFYNHSFRGYTYKLVSRKGTGKRLIMLPKDELIGNTSILEEDASTLSGKRVLLNGIEPANSIFNGDLYLTDPTGYRVLDIEETEELEKMNKYQIHLLLSALICQELRNNNFSSKVEREIKGLLELKDEDEDSSSYFKNIMGNCDTIKQFVKKMQ